MDKKIAILATGAIGSSAGADLTKAGYDVVLIDQWPAHVEAMKARGLYVTIRGEGEFQTPVRAFHLCELASLETQFDIVFLTAKSYDSRWLAQLINPYLKSDGVLVSAQNSINDEWIAPIIGPERDIGCVVELGAEVFEPGIVKRKSTHVSTTFVVGELDGQITPRVQEIAQIMNNVGQTTVSSNIWGAKWAKLVQNTASMAVTPIVGGTARELIDNYRDFSIKIGLETAEVAKALGYVLEPIFGLSDDAFEGATTEEIIEKLIVKLIDDFGGGGYNEGIGWRTCVVQDLVKGRPTEVPEHLSGFVAQKGRQVGVSTPINEAIASLMKEIEQGKREMRNPDNFKALKKFL